MGRWGEPHFDSLTVVSSFRAIAHTLRRLPCLRRQALQIGFLSDLRFHSEWAQWRFPQAAIDAKIAESEQLVELLDE
jgi:hypothetical protein